MLEPHTATFPPGSFSRKSWAAVAFQNLHPSIKQHPWFTPHTQHTKPHTQTPFPSFPFLYFHLNFFPSSLFFSLSTHPSLFGSSSILPSQTLSLQPPGHFRQAVCNRFINRLFSLCSKHSVGEGVVSQTLIDLYLTL